MLNTVLDLGIRVTGRPSAVWWQDRLYIAYTDLGGILCVGRLDVMAAPGGGWNSVSLWPVVERPVTIAAVGGTLYVAGVEGDGNVWLTTSTDGINFSPPTYPGFQSRAEVSIAGTKTTLWLGWLDDDLWVHLASSSDGITFSDHITPSGSRLAPALATSRESADETIAVAHSNKSGGMGSVSVSVYKYTSPGVFAHLGTKKLDEGLPEALNLGYAAGFPDADQRLIVVFGKFVPPANHSQYHRAFAHQIARDLGNPELGSALGVEELSAAPAYGAALAAGPGRVWAVWRNAFADEFMVAPYDIVFELPEELRAMLNQPCEVDKCPPDPRLVCGAKEEFAWIEEEAFIRNAVKGDLVVTPASGAGFIGRFLGELDFPQQYDHMGIVVEDRRVVRHATMAHARVKAKELYTGSVLGTPAPTNGLRPDLLKYGWPGTITQTVPNGFFPERGFNDGLNPEWTDPAPPAPAPWPGEGASQEAKDQWWKDEQLRRGFMDPYTADGYPKRGYAFANLTRKAQMRPDGTLVYPLVVKPEPKVEASTPGLRQLLHRVADVSRTIRGHYRFFSYTDADIARQANMVAPPASDPGWGSNAAGKWAAGSVPVVCSSFVWLAVMKANLLYPSPFLVIEGEPESTPEELKRAVGAFTLDGLYRYWEGERKKAAKAMYSYLHDQVRAEVWANLMTLRADNPWLFPVLNVGLATLTVLLFGPGALGVAAAAAYFGVTPGNIQDVLLWLNDMPNQLANQMCNAFASDRPDKIDDKDWETPGEGRAVAPHDMIHLWDAPQVSDWDTQLGLWGYPERLMLPEGRPEWRRKHVWMRAHGIAEVSGKVTFRGEAMAGAEVRVACRRALTDSEGFYRLEVGAARLEFIGGMYWPHTRWWLEGRLYRKAVPGSNSGFDIELEPPPEWRRLLTMKVHVDLVHQVLVGKDDWLHDQFYDGRSFTLHPQGAPPGGSWPKEWTNFKEPYLSDWAGDERVRLFLKATLLDDLSITVEARYQLLEDFTGNAPDGAGDSLEVEHTETATVARDGANVIEISLKSGETPPDRAWLKLELGNTREVA